MIDHSNVVAGNTSTEQATARGRSSPPSSRPRSSARRTPPASSPGNVRVSPYPLRARTPPQSTPPSASTSSPGHTASSPGNVRVSPYPLRARTPPSAPISSPGQTRASPSSSRARTSPQSTSAPTPPARQRARVSLDSSAHSEDEHRLQLIVGPIVKNTVGQRDASGKRLEDFVANGATFNDVLHKIWEKFRCHVKGQATQLDGVWSMEEPAESEWSKVMQFKWNRHLIQATKTDQGWNRWVSSLRGQTVTLMIYEYGLGIPNAHSLDEFLTACIRPERTDRAGATAESSLREVVSRLREVWGATYQGSAVVWRMWANDITRNLDRSTWEVSILDPPTARVERLLRAADSEVELHIERLTRSSRIALDCVNAAIADNERLQNDWKAFGLRLTNQRQVLAARKESIEGFLDELPLPAATDVENPLTNIANVEDTEHQE